MRTGPVKLIRVIHRRNGDDDGAALITVLLITMLITSLLAVVVSATLTNLRGSGLDRKRNQTSAAAEAGVDATLANLQISTSAAALSCSPLTGTTGGASYSAAVTYYSTYPPTSASILNCSNNAASGSATAAGTLTGAPLAALITSLGSAVAPYHGAAASYGNRTMTALARLTPGTATGPRMDVAVYSDNGVTLTNQWKLMSVNGSAPSFYTGHDFACNSNPIINGSIYVQGNASLTNQCWVDGDVWANGDVTTSTTGVHVGGSIKSSTGSLLVGNNGLFIGKDVLVGGTCCNKNGPPPKTGDGTNLVLPNGQVKTGLAANPVPVSTFPQLMYPPTQTTATTLPWATWELQNAIANNAPTSSPARAGSCSVAGSSDSLNGPLVSPATATIIDANSCDMTWRALSIQLNGDLTIYLSSLVSSNGINVTSGDGAKHVLRIIVPWPPGATSCVGNSGNGQDQLTFDSGGTAIGSNINMLLYTPGQVKMTNNIDFYGQIYACSLSASVNVTVHFVAVGSGDTSGGSTPTPYKVDVAYLRDS
jgi:Tfp pilus assembly protein PilX